MNILFFLSPKQDLMYVYDDFTLRQTLEKWENNRYASIPVLNRRGEYVGTLTEGDILWGLKKYHGLDLEAAEDVPISAFPHKRDYKAVTVTTSMDQLIEAAMNQNFVPVVDDRGIFIGIVRRQAIIRYCYEKSREEKAPQPGKSRQRGKGILAAGNAHGNSVALMYHVVVDYSLAHGAHKLLKRAFSGNMYHSCPSPAFAQAKERSSPESCISG